jgi:cystathionine gamma-synthase
MNTATQAPIRGWHPDELGQPLPASRHAVSVSLPTWKDVVGYEEKKPEVIDRLASGYPRFVIHPLVQEAARQLARGQPCLPFPSRRAAEAAAEFVRRGKEAGAQVVEDRGLYGVVTAGTGFTSLKLFWQHAGLIVSSRQAEAFLAARGAGSDGEEARRSLRRQLAELYDCAEDDVFLKPSGMAAVFAALQAVMEPAPGRPTAQLGFPYVDSLKLQQKLGRGAILLHHLEDVDRRLASLLERERLAGCFCEIPGNPLLNSADLRRVSPLLRQHRVPLVVDDVVATPVNVDLSGHGDLVATSLTKFFVGTGDAMGGALICHPRSPLYHELKPLVRARHEELLWAEDAAVLEKGGRDFRQRMHWHNQSGLKLAERLRQHPAIERVWYPKWESSEAYEGLRRADGGWGALLTFLPYKAESRAPLIYDRLQVAKGPSLGTVFTLACPFTLLAHYAELDWAEACGVSRYLIRLSVGLEEPEELWRRLEAALED